MSVDWERRGPAAWVTFNRPEAHNAMTFEMYEQLYARCERADADDDVRVLVLRGAGGKAFVAGTDIRQFLEFSSPEDGLEYERTIDRIVGRLEAVRKPTIALVDGFAMGSGLALSAACDLRICTPAAVVRAADRAHRRQLPVDGELRAAGRAARRGAREGHRVHGAARSDADEALAIGLATEVVDDAAARVEELCELLAGHAAMTMWATKEALRRLRPVPDGDDLVREVYGSAEFRERVEAFLKR